MKCGNFFNLFFKGTLFLYLLSFYNFAYSQPKVLICQDVDIPSTTVEGFARTRSPDKEIVYFKSPNIKECLEQVEDGDKVYINAHGLPGLFRWHGIDYLGFGNGDKQVPLPNNFANLRDVNIHLVMCYSGSGNPSVADTLSKVNKNIVVESYSEICYTDIKIDLGSIDLDLHQTVERVNNAYWELYLQKAIRPTVHSIDEQKFHDTVEKVIQHVKNQYPDFKMDRLFVDLLLAIELLEDWHSLPPINRPGSEVNHETFVRELFSSFGFSEIGKHVRVVGYYIRDVHKNQEKGQREEDTFSSCEECQEDCGGDMSTISSKPTSNVSTLYCIHDDDRNDSQFCYGVPLPIPSIIGFGPEYQNCDIEALDIQHKTDHLYAASGDDTPRKGHLYYVSKADGDVIDLGKINCCNEVDAISFHPTSGDLWGWAQDVGLFVINPFPYPDLRWPFFPPNQPFPPGIPILPEVNINNPKCLPPQSPVPAIHADVILPAQMEMEDLTWNWPGTVIYAVENVHIHPDPDSHGDVEDLWPSPNFDFDFEESDVDNDGVEEGIRLWAYDSTNGVLREICHNLAPSIAAILGKKAEVEALESLPNDILEPPVPDNQDLLLMGFHGPFQLRYAVIETPPLPLPPLPTPLSQCKIVWKDAIPSPFNDIEGIAYSPNPKP